MRLVFFDIECASVYKTSAKICAFGYVECDENFNIINKEDILINPQGKFHLTDGKGEKGLVLPYRYEEFKNYPVFTQVFARIKSLLEDKEALVYGHATLNDVNYLNLETKRFRLPSFEFNFSDSQIMYMTSIGDFSRQFGLEHITESLGVEFTPHRAADDAYATMRVVEALCKKHDCSCWDLHKKLGMRRGKIADYKITPPDSVAFINYRKQASALKEERFLRKKRFNELINKKRIVKGGRLKGVVFKFSTALQENFPLAAPLIDKIYALGGRYSSKLTYCTYYVSCDGDKSLRTFDQNNFKNLKIISVDELRGILDD